MIRSRHSLCVFLYVSSCVCLDCMCVIMCTNYVNYIRGRTYIGNANTRVEKHNLRSSRNKRMVRDIKYNIGRHLC